MTPPSQGNLAESQLLTVQEAADRLNVGERFIRRLVFEKRIPYTKVGKHVRILEMDLAAFIESGRVEGESA